MMAEDKNRKALSGIRILDFSWVLAGPYATRILADFGAEVIRVQPKLPRAEDRFSRYYDSTWGRNKLGVTLNLDNPAGVAVAQRLVAVSDAVVENFSPRVMANWGLGYDALKKMKRDIIMLSMSAMGSSGPWKDYVGFGPTVQAFSGITYLTAYPGGPPLGLGTAYADHVAGLVACLALLGALEYRRRTGAGQYIDISQLEAMVSLLGDSILEYQSSGKAEPSGNHSLEAAPHNVYRCLGEDRWCAIAVFTDEEWRALKQAMGNPSGADETRFSTLSARLKNTNELDSLVEAWTRQHTAEAVMSRLQQDGVAGGVVEDAAGLADNPHLKARGFFVEQHHPELGEIIADAQPIRLSETPARYNRAAPSPGRDNEYVYRKLLGMSVEELVELKKRGII